MPRYSKFSKEDLRLIRDAAVERERLREEAMKLSNEALARKMDTSPTTISCIINHYYHYNNRRQ